MTRAKADLKAANERADLREQQLHALSLLQVAGGLVLALARAALEAVEFERAIEGQPSLCPWCRQWPSPGALYTAHRPDCLRQAALRAIRELEDGYGTPSAQTAEGACSEEAAGTAASGGEALADCYAKLRPGEPYFVLRAQDKLSADLVWVWAQWARTAGSPHAKVRGALDCADAMESWGRQHGTKVPN